MSQYEKDGVFFDTEIHKIALIQTPRAAALATAELYEEFAGVPVVDLASLAGSDRALPPILRIRGQGIVPEVSGEELVVFDPKTDPRAETGIVFAYHMARSPILVGEREIPDAVIIGQPSHSRVISGMAYAAAGDFLLVAQAARSSDGRRVLTPRYAPISSIHGGFRDVYFGMRKIQQASPH